jgi:hypothetical protein
VLLRIVYRLTIFISTYRSFLRLFNGSRFEFNHNIFIYSIEIIFIFYVVIFFNIFMFRNI